MLFGYYWGCLAIILEGITTVDRHHSGPSHGHLAKKSYAGFGKSILFSGTHCFYMKNKKELLNLMMYSDFTAILKSLVRAWFCECNLPFN